MISLLYTALSISSNNNHGIIWAGGEGGRYEDCNEGQRDAVSIVSFCWTVLVHISHIICFPRDEIKTKLNKQEDTNDWSLNSNFYYLSVSDEYY